MRRHRGRRVFFNLKWNEVTSRLDFISSVHIVSGVRKEAQRVRGGGEISQGYTIAQLCE